MQDADDHIGLILDRYSDRKNIGIHVTPVEQLEQLYIHYGLALAEIRGKVVLELGAGCSQYAGLFLKHGCKTYIANDLIKERLDVIAVDDPRFKALPGDFLKVNLSEKADIIFCSLTLMMLKPLFNDFARAISSNLKPGGVFVCMEANYTCPLTLWRWWRRYDPSVQIYSPWSMSKAMKDTGLVVERMTPVTAPLPWTKGIWPLGSVFWLRTKKPLSAMENVVKK